MLQAMETGTIEYDGGAGGTGGAVGAGGLGARRPLYSGMRFHQERPMSLELRAVW